MLNIEQIKKRFTRKEDWVLNSVSLEVQEGEFIALLGESGSGKTTLLRILAGLEEPDSGIVSLSGKQLVSPNKSVPPEKRNISMVFQDYALFPHLTVTQNIEFGIARSSKTVKRESVQMLLEKVNLESLEKRYPHELSGGQQQRVALARALAPKPDLMLLDEPFSSLDTILKDEMREEVKRIIKDSGTTAVFVTHDTQDALCAADKVAILKDGKLNQYGTPSQLYNEPSNEYSANFMGKSNCIRAIASQGGFQTDFGFITFLKDQNHVSALLVVRPEDVQIASSAKGALDGKVVTTQYYGDHQIIRLTKGNSTILIRADKNLQFSKGQDISFSINYFFPIKTSSK